jgi:hypothetical protein
VQTGMLWFDEDKGRRLTEKVREACGYYEGKYGQKPNQCVVHADMLEGGELEIEGVRVIGSKKMQRNHLWVGWSEEFKRAKKPGKRRKAEGRGRRSTGRS